MIFGKSNLLTLAGIIVAPNVISGLPCFTIDEIPKNIKDLLDKGIVVSKTGNYTGSIKSSDIKCQGIIVVRTEILGNKNQLSSLKTRSSNKPYAVPTNCSFFHEH